MTNISTNLMSALLNNESIDEVFRSELENAVNEVLSTELTAFLNYEKYDYSGRNSGDSRNGFYGIPETLAMVSMTERTNHV
ncbi:Transposase, Mutator family, partial [Lachnospiraceae bacterium C7]